MCCPPSALPCCFLPELAGLSQCHRYHLLWHALLHLSLNERRDMSHAPFCNTLLNHFAVPYNNLSYVSRALMLHFFAAHVTELVQYHPLIGRILRIEALEGYEVMGST